MFAVFSTIHSRILLTECASESLYSVQNIAIHRIRLIFDSSNTLVYRLGPNIQQHLTLYTVPVYHCIGIITMECLVLNSGSILL